MGITVELLESSSSGDSELFRQVLNFLRSSDSAVPIPSTSQESEALVSYVFETPALVVRFRDTTY